MTGTVLRFDRLEDGTLVATASHLGRSVAAIVHPQAYDPEADALVRRWTLAGDVDPSTRVSGSCGSATTATAHAAKALGDYLGVTVDGYEVAR